MERFSGDFNAGYILNHSIGLYVKHCNKRLTPWRFSFQPDHLQQMLTMRRSLDKLFAMLVCNDDGIVCLSHEEVARILNPQQETTKWIRADRRPRHMYSVTGSDGNLEFKVGVSDYQVKLFDAIGTISPGTPQTLNDLTHATQPENTAS
ncbi:MAG: hypothetical protein FWD61_19385 [Phycisphaerales bacterium]|nr:hypothetical protein [Phycisphaerales bacterium]